ncbi:MAG: PBP1A family penicillin-binding protein [Proteobacteria bacterium]|nr:PBP1A family penicillin-binding protein [Pseudomonadota bacterium]
MRRTVHIVNRHPGGYWWKIPLALVLWLPMAAPMTAGGIGVAVLRQYAADLPRVPDLDRWAAGLPRTSTIVAADGTVLAEIPFQAGAELGHRFPVAFADIPETLVKAVLAAEDARFFAHRGVDPQAVARAAWANYRAGRVVEGASTITQQVARNLLPDTIGHQRTLRRKIREALLARRIEARYSKQRIFEVYVNHTFLGAGAYGIRAAARAYFSSELNDLDLAEVALIAGMAQAPGRANPYRDAEAARLRRDEVLTRMARAGLVSAVQAAAARARPIELTRPPLRYGALAPWYTERARREVDRDWPTAYRRGGLHIETAASSVTSMAAMSAARRWSAEMGSGRQHGRPQVAALIWDHQTGYIEATVGGLDWAESRFDRATQACRQPGSAFKPIVYAAAIESGAITPGTALRDAPIAEYDEELDVHWKPANSGRSFRGVALAQDALALSLNSAAVDVLDRAGSNRVIDLARRLGITTELADVRPLALGASCVIPLELAGAFAMFARRGEHVAPTFVVRVRRGDEVLVDRASPRDPTLAPDRRLDRLIAAATEKPERAVDQSTAFLISQMLVDVVKRGTATAARRVGRPAAGKTGTTNDNTDAWFIGYTGRLISAVWIGHDDPKKPLGKRDDGSRAALPLWMDLVRLAEGNRKAVAVPGEPPPGMVRVRVDRETGFLAQPGAGGAVDLYFKRGTEPIHYTGQIHGLPADLNRASRQF